MFRLLSLSFDFTPSGQRCQSWRFGFNNSWFHWFLVSFCHIFSLNQTQIPFGNKNLTLWLNIKLSFCNLCPDQISCNYDFAVPKSVGLISLLFSRRLTWTWHLEEWKDGFKIYVSRFRGSMRGALEMGGRSCASYPQIQGQIQQDVPALTCSGGVAWAERT